MLWLLYFLYFIVLLFDCQSVWANKNSTGTSLTATASPTNAHDFSPYYRNHCKTHTNKCTVVDVSINSLSTRNLINSLENNDFLRQEQELLANHHVYYAIITIKDLEHTNHTINGNSSIIHKQYEELDAFILERPWWKVQQYPVIYQHQSRALPLLLEHVPRFVTEVSKALLAIHFPPKEECLKRKMYIRAEMSSWGIDIGGIGDYMATFPDYIHGFFLPNRGKNVREGYADKNMGGCATKFNIRTCVFLETTNCSYPPSFVKYCDAEVEFCPVTGIYNAYNRSYLGNTEDPPLPHIPGEKLFPQVENWNFVTSPAYDSNHPYTLMPSMLRKTERYMTMHSNAIYQYQWIFGIAYKYNYHLGVRVQEFLQEFYASYRKPEKEESFTVHDHCVGVHIRKGDRSLPGVNMIEWCKNHTSFNSKGEREIIGKWIDGNKISRGQYMDMGCTYAMPFGSVNIQHIVNGSLALVNETLYSSKHRLNVLVMTDELPTLQKELAEFHQSGYAREKVRIVVFPTKIANVHKSRLSWQATVEWWAGIEALKKCSGFIMHTASAASSAIFMSMCYNHGEGYMQCPPILLIQ